MKTRRKTMTSQELLDDLREFIKRMEKFLRGHNQPRDKGEN